MRKNIFVLFFFCIILFFTVTIISIQTQTKSNAAQVTGNLSLHFEAIDKNNNNVPKHSQRKISLYFYKTNDFSIQPQAKITDYVSYANGTFSNPSLDLSSVAPDTYYILVKSPEGSLAEIVNNAQPVAIASNQTILLNTPV